ncbi:hypothetical protein GQ43DRAFT_301259 [Delitschia confertaspora ATCC 74209]|uniref:Uncharacterized protein n=1 Tax=Delitschia confertaspora ATCC 74209 TaxID=1513339 RepID=A0A9P4MTP7_9PLEO|nr:hypothetical protein GQ43DRAFT_301259 [Delitschia confertaspora ATCC 74209]
MDSSALTPAQTHALFDILLHHSLHSEICSFKNPHAIDTYGYPFCKSDGVQTQSPLLQNLLNKFALPLPGLNSVDSQFWTTKVRGLMVKLGEAELSESYDKGGVGARRVLSTGFSALLEYVGWGMLGGYPKKAGVDKRRQYDIQKVEDVIQAWDDALQELVYGDLVDEALGEIRQTEVLGEHSSLIQAVHEYILLNLASLLHHIFVLSPDGQYLLHIIESVHRLIPYPVLRQTLRVGNAATMINGMVKLFLTKLSVTAVTNWIGLTNNVNDGMNLLQQIISQVMAWDTAEFQKRAKSLEHTKSGPSKDSFSAIRTHVQAPRQRHEELRSKSIKQSKSITAVILESASPPIDISGLSEEHHSILQDFYSTLLSIRDREELTKILCKMQPDLLTSLVRDLVSAYDPIIRAVHNAVDLSGTVSDLQAFLDDLVKVGKRKTNGSGVKGGDAGVDGAQDGDSDIPTVEDFVSLLRKHIPSAHRFMHQVAKNAPDLVNQYREYAKSCIAEFQVRDASSQMQDEEAAAGSMTQPLNALFAGLQKEEQERLRKILDRHATHLSHLKDTSTVRLKRLMNIQQPHHKKSHLRRTMHGPGIFLARWRALLDTTLITPSAKEGTVRHGWDVKGSGVVKGKNQNDGLNGDKDSGQTSVEVKKDRKDECKDGAQTLEVWEAMRESWEGVLRGLEVMGPT